MNFLLVSRQTVHFLQHGRLSTKPGTRILPKFKRSQGSSVEHCRNLPQFHFPILRRHPWTNRTARSIFLRYRAQSIHPRHVPRRPPTAPGKVHQAGVQADFQVNPLAVLRACRLESQAEFLHHGPPFLFPCRKKGVPAGIAMHLLSPLRRNRALSILTRPKGVTSSALETFLRADPSSVGRAPNCHRRRSQIPILVMDAPGARPATVLLV